MTISFKDAVRDLKGLRIFHSGLACPSPLNCSCLPYVIEIKLPKQWPLICRTIPALTNCSAAKSLQLCPTLYDPIDGSPPGPTNPGILQARTLEWVAISSSNAWKWKVKVKSLSCVRLLATPWTAAYQASAPMGFSRQEYWSGLPLPSPRLSINSI